MKASLRGMELRPVVLTRKGYGNVIDMWQYEPPPWLQAVSLSPARSSALPCPQTPPEKKKL